ncbi:MAG: long-subunit fatty acid transport protein, partial [Oleiphilaceae bacterium]
MKLLPRKIKKLAVFLLIGGLIFPPQLLAQLANGVSVDVRAMALGNAMVADINPGISSVYHNPASLTRLKERHFEVDNFVIGADLDNDFYAPEDYELFGLEGTGFNTYDPTVPRDPVVGGDGFGSGHTNKLALYLP